MSGEIVLKKAKIYHDSDGNECSLLQAVHREPQWAASRVQEGEKAIKELADAKREAESLALSLWANHYMQESPDFELCDSVAGVISQIDNMTTGLSKS